MSKLRRSNICSSPRNRNNKVINDDYAEESPNGKLKLNKRKLISHGEFLNRIQRSLYYGGGKTKISIPLSDYIADTFSETHRGYSLNRLNYATVGNLHSTPCSLILAMIYLERLKDADPAYTKQITPTELFLVSMMVATKFYSGHDDEAPYVNWAEYANMTPDNLLQMELAFLCALDWKVYVSNEEFHEKVKSLETTLARRQGMHRGWFTYVELDSLLPSIQIAKHFLQTTLVLGLSYTAFVATMVASVFLVSQIPGTCLNSSSRTSTTHHDVASTNDSSTTSQPIDSNHTITTFAMEDAKPVIDHDHSRGFESNILLDLAIDRLNETSDRNDEKPVNQTEWNLKPISSWSSFLNGNTFIRSVITNDLNRHGICDMGLNREISAITTDSFCNSTSPFKIFSFQPDTEPIKFDFHGITSTFA